LVTVVTAPWPARHVSRSHRQTVGQLGITLKKQEAVCDAEVTVPDRKAQPFPIQLDGGRVAFGRSVAA
jgi:hypothetical protein